MSTDAKIDDQGRLIEDPASLDPAATIDAHRSDAGVPSDGVSSAANAEIRRVLKQYWGYDRFRPLQREAMESVVTHRDSVVVLPTGGGKSLCYQVPALCDLPLKDNPSSDASNKPRLAVVVSPLISLMKDQVDGLKVCGAAAECVNSSQPPDERRRIAQQIRRGELRLLYLSPERLVTDRMLDFLQTVSVSFFAIDEAHCISSWGHDFRPEYRLLKKLKERFPKVGVHAYTATASDKVRKDIADQLGLESPTYLVGSFDRPNLTYRVRRKAGLERQIDAVLQNQHGESGIIYCISRNEVDQLATRLRQQGHQAAPYHAGLTDQERRENQEAFIEDRVQIVVATVAFGMGIDKPNVRYVIHAGMPKSLEGYQQESGRAGRDGLESECWLFYSPGDYLTWQRMLDSEEAQANDGALESLQAMSNFCTSVICRHQSLVSYFGQELESESCGACDVCLNELEVADDPLETSQKIASCVVRLGQRFGADYTAQVLAGSRDQRILQQGHHELSTWGLLSQFDKLTVRDWIEQLVAQRYLAKSGEYNVLHVTERGRKVLRGEVTPRLLKPPKRKRKASSSRHGGRSDDNGSDSWQGVDRQLFESLRVLRRDQAEERSVPAYIVFGDASLRDMARRKPTSLEAFRDVKGVGDKKCQDFGDLFVEHIRNWLKT